MPASVTAKFTIQGDVTGAVSAATEFGKAITSLNRRMTSLASKSPQIDQFSQVLGKFNQALSGFTRRSSSTERAADRMAAAFDRVGAAYQRLLTTMQTPLPQQQGLTAPKATATSGSVGAATRQAEQEMQRARTQIGNAIDQIISKFSNLYPTVQGVTNLFSNFGKVSSGGLGSVVSVLGTVISKATPLLVVFEVAFRGIRGLIDRARQSVINFGQSLDNIKVSTYGVYNTVQRWLMNMFDGLRLITLGLTNIARSVMFFISIPLGAALYQIGGAVLNWDNQMKGVQKTTGLLNKEMDVLIPQLRNLAKTTALSHAQLGLMAEQAGQLGVYTIPGIVELVKTGNYLAIATDITAESVIESLGKIANAFAWNLNKSQDEIWRMANVINILENETAASAAEIVETLLKFAPVASFLRITAYDAAALGATLVSTGYDAGNAATALRNIGVYMVKNLDDVERLLGGLEKYEKAGSLATAMQENFVEVIFDFVLAGSQEKDILQALREEFDILNLRGGRGMAQLTTAIEQLHYNLAIARAEWEAHSSLMYEYDRAMSSTQNQLKLLNNYLVDLGITVGETVLPVINQAIQHLIPVVEILTSAFAELDEETQLMIVAFVAFMAIGGPLFMFLSQVTHGFFLMGMGISTLFRLVPGVVNLIINLIQVFTGLGGILLGLPVKFGLLIFGVLKLLDWWGVDIASFFNNLAERAYTWGENLAATYASGLLAGAARWIAAAISAIARMISSFFAAHSPPEKGPLRDIQKWGTALLETYLRGFKLADFSILEDVAKIIQDILQNRLAQGKLKLPDLPSMYVDEEDKRGTDQAKRSWDEAQIYPMIARARVLIAKMLSEFNKTGVISMKILDELVEGLGSYGDKIKDLVKAWIDYRNVQRQLEEIENRRAMLKRTYSEELKAIATSGKHIEERVSLMRDAMQRHNQQLTLMDEEEESLKAQADQLKENLDWQQAFLRTLTQQDDLMSRLIDILDRLADTLEKLDKLIGGAGGEEPGFEFGEPIEPDWEEAFDNLKRYQEELYNLQYRISEARVNIKAFWAALRGEGEPTGRGETFWRKNLGEEGYRTWTQWYEWGEKVREMLMKVRGAIDAIKGERISGPEWESMTPEQQEAYDESFERMSNIKTAAEEVIGTFGEAKDAVTGFFDAFRLGTSHPFPQKDVLPGEEYRPPITWERLKEGTWENFLGLPGVGLLAGVIDGFQKQIAEPWGRLMQTLEDMQTEFQGIKEGFTDLFSIEGLDINFGTTLIGLIERGLSAVTGEAIGRVLGWIVGVFVSIFNAIGSSIELKASLGNSIVQFLNDLKDGKDWDTAVGDLAEAVVEAFCEWFIDSLGGIAEAILPGISEALTPLAQDIVSGLFDTGGMGDYEFLSQKIGEWVEKFLSYIRRAFGAESPSTKMASIGSDLVSGLINGFNNAWETLLTNLGLRMDESIAKITSFLEPYLEKGEELRDKIDAGLTTDWETLFTNLSTRLTDTKTKIEEFQETFREKGDELRAKVSEGFLDPDKWETFKSDMVVKVTELRDKILTLWEMMRQAGVDLIAGLTQGAKERIDAFIRELPNIIARIIDAIAEKFDLDSPSRVTYQMGLDIGQGLVDGVNDISEAVILFFETTFGAFRAAAENALLLGWDETTSLLAGTLEDMAHALKAQSMVFESLGSTLGDAIVSGIYSALGALKNLDLGGLVSGISGGLKNTKDAVKNNFTDPVIDTVREVGDGLKILSPSRVTTDMGEDIGMGFVLGLLNSINELRKASWQFYQYLPGWNSVYPGMTGLVGSPAAAAGGVQVNLNINHPIIRDDIDIRKLAREVQRELNNSVYSSNRMGGILP